jgi:methylenetetrahydrofolate--tRNA-(uracil-5-)-methyltransferase
VHAGVAEVEDFDRKAVFESCMPIETMASRGMDTIRFGPLKPVGLTDPATGMQPHAVVQLRQDDVSASLYSLVGFQTRLRHPEQKRVFSMIPGLENANFVRYGVMHRNTYIASPGILSAHLEATGCPGLFFAGQMTGVEGYVESAATGLVAGLQAVRRVRQESPLTFSAKTVTGALLRYVSEKRSRHFQPMNANYGILEPLEGRYKSKEERYAAMAERSLREIDVAAGLPGCPVGADVQQPDTDLV